MGPGSRCGAKLYVPFYWPRAQLLPLLYEMAPFQARISTQATSAETRLPATPLQPCQARSVSCTPGRCLRRSACVGPAPSVSCCPRFRTEQCLDDRGIASLRDGPAPSVHALCRGRLTMATCDSQPLQRRPVLLPCIRGPGEEAERPPSRQQATVWRVPHFQREP